MDLPGLLVGIGVGVVSAIAVAVLAPKDGRLVRWLRRSVGDRPYTIVVETDPRRMPLQPAILPLEFYFERPDPAEPMYVSHEDWWAWAHEHSGVDARETRLTIFISTTRAGVVLRGLHILDAVTPVSGGVIRSPGELGGGHAPVLLASVDLDESPPEVLLEAPDGTLGPFTPYRLDADDLMVLTLLARAGSSRHEWTLELDLLIDGQPTRHQVSNTNGEPFVTVGAAGVRQESWVTEYGEVDEQTGEWTSEPRSFWLAGEEG